MAAATSQPHGTRNEARREARLHTGHGQRYADNASVTAGWEFTFASALSRDGKQMVGVGSCGGKPMAFLMLLPIGDAPP